MANAAHGAPDVGGFILQIRELGKTGIQVSVIGLGTVKFGRNQGVKYPTAFELPTDHDLANLLDIAKECGINLLDTAPAYGISEERLGKLLKGQRADWILSTKAGEEFINGQSHFDFSPDAVRASVERSLIRLKTDYLDIVLGHSNGDDLRIVQEDGLLDTLSVLKREGKIRAFGLSTKTIEGGLAAVAASDVVMVTLNPEEQQDREIIEAARQQNKGVLIKKALASGHVRLSPDEALKQVLAVPGVSSVIIGTLNPLHLRQNVAGVR